MLAWTINFASLATLLVASVLVMVVFKRSDRGPFALSALGVGALAGTALAVSGVMLISGWAERMETFDFSGYEPIIDARRRVTGGPLTAIYYWPYLMIILGAATTYAFGHHLYLRVRDGDTYAADDEGD
jgi:hypothetical protein